MVVMPLGPVDAGVVVVADVCGHGGGDDPRLTAFVVDVVGISAVGEPVSVVVDALGGWLGGGSLGDHPVLGVVMVVVLLGVVVRSGAGGGQRGGGEQRSGQDGQSHVVLARAGAVQGTVVMHD
ncbi:MAG: hypothetical protein EA398_09490 [Deltaproteobacteria bacterium]|nr:MAG: hypothetical protein EA398_09490 [Deltaproteobacteria bacterium]